MIKMFRFKTKNNDWSQWYHLYSKEFNTLIKHLNWLTLEAIESKYE